ncbi:MAG: sulfatase-like hydrolase/transferase, partial [Lachnospiraceae bacterium]|nr:sulfatase-like hydrolase/transferase [Lachnospiraceae bacterium]
YGGYEYVPEEMIKRDKEPMVDKHDEALKVMPKVFLDEGYEVTICDPTYAGYTWIPDLTVFDEYPEMHTYYTNGVFNFDHTLGKLRTDEIRYRNFFCYSISKIVPTVLYGPIYNAGNYHEIPKPESIISSQIVTGPSTATGLFEPFVNAYTVLEKLPELTEPTGKEENTFLMMSNDTTHEPMILQKPDYVPVENVDNTAYDAEMLGKRVIDGVEVRIGNEEQLKHYDANVASLLMLGRWFDYLRQEGVYDNTKIIIVSDHGRALEYFDHKIDGGMDLDAFRCFLMVKDFGASGFTTDDTFMTNADVPTLAFKDVVEDPKNPFTGKPINSDAKEDEMLFSDPNEWRVSYENTPRDGNWYHFSGRDIFDITNWKYLGNY